MDEVVISVFGAPDVIHARRTAKDWAAGLGFEAAASEEIALAVSELAANVARHAGHGTLIFRRAERGQQVGIEIEALDRGAGISDVENALADGVSTAGGLGGGLGAVNRLMDELDLDPQPGAIGGTRVLARRWVRAEAHSALACPLEFGAAARAHPGMGVNGDAFVVRRRGNAAVAAVIDGLGHGPHAHQAAQAARQYVERHFEQAIPRLFLGVDRACRATRGVVLALARFECRLGLPVQLLFAGLGNVEARLIRLAGPSHWAEPDHLIVRRAVVGSHAPAPLVQAMSWSPGHVLVMHSDGLRPGWQWGDFAPWLGGSASGLAHQLLRALARDDDDATVIVVKAADL